MSPHAGFAAVLFDERAIVVIRVSTPHYPDEAWEYSLTVCSQFLSVFTYRIDRGMYPNLRTPPSCSDDQLRAWRKGRLCSESDRNNDEVG